MRQAHFSELSCRVLPLQEAVELNRTLAETGSQELGSRLFLGRGL